MAKGVAFARIGRGLVIRTKPKMALPSVGAVVDISPMPKWFARDAGFTLPEAAIALAVLAIGIVMTITPVMAALGGLHRAKLVSIASNLAQGQVEEIRSLPYFDVGFPSSSPAGVLNATETITVQGVDFEVKTEVEYVGSLTGLDILPGGGDGVPSVPDTGVDYKRVTITVSHPDGFISDVLMDTIVAPPNLAAHEGKANVTVNLIRHNPFGVKDPAVNPKVCLTRDTLPDIVSSTTDDTQRFAVIDPNQPDPPKPNYWYYVRLSPTGCDIYGGFPDEWRIHPDNLTTNTERVHAGTTQSVTANVTIYRAATIEVNIYEEDGDDFENNAYLYVEHAGGTTVLDQGDWSADGTWTINSIDGYPVVPGLITFSVTAEDHLPINSLSVQVPSGYPSDLDHVEDLTLATATMGTVQVDVVVKDAVGEVIHGALVAFTKSGLWTDPIVLPTDENGLVHAYLPDTGLDSFAVTSPYGHVTHGPVAWSPTDDTVTLLTPATHGTIYFDKAGPGDFGFRDSASPDDFQQVLANNSGKASAAVLPATYDVVKLCDDGTIAATGTVTITGPGDTAAWGASQGSC